MTQHIVIVGGGSAGVAAAARLDRKSAGKCRITVVEPADYHYYRSAYNLVAAGLADADGIRRRQSRLIPERVIWEHQRATGFEPDRNRVRLGSGEVLSYDALIVCTGLESNWELIKGARDALGRNGVCSVYTPALADYTWNCVQNLGSASKAVFTQPDPPYSYPFASHDVACLSADALAARGLLASCRLHYMTASNVLTPIPAASAVLQRALAGYGVRPHGYYRLTAVDGARRTAVFNVIGGADRGKTFAIEFAMLHITPPQSPPAAVKESPLANAAGYLDVDPRTLRHVRYGNVFGLGDVCATPNPKTISAVYRQVPVVAANVLSVLKGRQPGAGYDGYSLAVLTTARGKAVFVHTVYGGTAAPGIGWYGEQAPRLNWWLKRRLMPLFYWHYLLKGYAWFPEARRKPDAAPGEFKVAS